MVRLIRGVVDMPNRYCRDELIKIALQMAQLSNLEIHDMPTGTVSQDAFSIQWLQDILDFWYHMVPFSATVKNVALSCIANQNYVVLPSNFILDVRNGYTVRTISNDPLSLRRITRMPLQKFINRRLTYQKSVTNIFPWFYCIQDTDTLGNQLMQITPTPTVSTVGELWYYALPPLLDAGDKPRFPSDYVCIEYIRIRALEWSRIMEPGTAQKFCDKIVAGMKAAGLMNEPEDDEIPFDTQVWGKGLDSLYANTYAWMGPT